jgi:hypothetical protein
MYLTDCHSNHDFRTIYMWNEIWLVLHPLYTNSNLSNWIYTICTSSYTSSSCITVSKSHSVAAGAFRSRQLVPSILSICIACIMFYISSGILFQCWKRSLHVPIQCQLRVSKPEFCIPLYVSASNTTRRQLPWAQLSKEWCTAVAANNENSGVILSLKWHVYGRRVKLHMEFSKKVFAIMPNRERCRNIFFGI